MTAAQTIASTLLSEETPKEFLRRHISDWKMRLHAWDYVFDPSRDALRRRYYLKMATASIFVSNRDQWRGLYWEILFSYKGQYLGGNRLAFRTHTVRADEQAYRIETFMHKYKHTDFTAKSLAKLFVEEVKILGK